jgi:hypothetical protein
MHSFRTINTAQRCGIPTVDYDYAYNLCTAVSVLIAKKRGAKIDLYTDNAGAERFCFLSYDNIYIVPDMDKVNPCFWAAGKIFAYLCAPIGTVHIDMDVYLNSDKLLQLLENKGKQYDLIVQNEDYKYNGIAAYKEFCRLLPKGVKDLPEFDLSGSINAYCCGTVAFGSEKLRDAYCKGYFKIQEALEKSPLWKIRDRHVSFDLMAEQAWLYACAKNDRVFKILPDSQKNHSVSGSAELGYSHLAFTSKYEPEVIRTNECILKRIAPEILEKLKG